MTVDGWVGKKTRSALHNATASLNPFDEPTKDIKRGATGDTVKWIQWELVDSGYDIDIDGSFGPATDKAVRDFQKKFGLAIDGWVGKNTRAALKSNSRSKDQTKAG